MLMTRLGIPWIWGADVEKAWSFMRWWVAPATMLLAPGSYGYGLDRVPAEGGAVLAANHLSAIDPPFIGSFCRRGLWWMMKAELLDIPFVGEALTWTGAFPIRRGQPDREAIRKARELVGEGHLVGIFVEGTRQRLGYPGPIQPGALTVAMREGAPIVPCAVESFGWSLDNRRACCVVFGEPLRFDDMPPNGRSFREAGAVLEGEIRRLWRQAAEAVAAGFPPELPDGTPRGGWIRPGREVRVRTPRRVSGIAEGVPLERVARVRRLLVSADERVG
jgi:1-acyl-sn-glycerol-3-phosphate acyltransferase